VTSEEGGGGRMARGMVGGRGENGIGGEGVHWGGSRLHKYLG
jgi:hypothetical protein